MPVPMIPPPMTPTVDTRSVVLTACSAATSAVITLPFLDGP